ncbi:MAG: AAA family ATPase, partial [Thermoanaerobacterium sp.]|nr:AAA family ATPase [Thermoanaerobacterium sp.]
MLKSWSVENFKAIVNSGDLQLAPVTVLAGLNSSGKSSLLQSILMISQTLSSRVLDRALLPNGPIVQLGTFEDILNEASKIRPLTIKFKFEFEEDKEEKEENNDGFGIGSTLEYIDVGVQFLSTSDNSIKSAIGSSQVIAEKVVIKVASDIYFPFEDDFDYVEATFSIRKVSDKVFEDFLSNVETTSLHTLPLTFNKLSGYLGTLEGGEEEYLVILSHFLPSHFFRRIKVEKHIKNQLIRAISAFFEYPSDDAYGLLDDELLKFVDFDANMPEDVRKNIYEICNNEIILEKFSGYTVRDLAEWLKSLKVGRKNSRKKGLLVRQAQEIIAQYYTKEWLTEKQYDRETEGLELVFRNFNDIKYACDYITRFFTSKIRYLGPLRADPQASQKFATSGELDDVGTKGEYAGAVYDANQRLFVDWYDPYTQKIERHILSMALDTWARYLGVAEGIQIETAGRSGVNWQVIHTQGHRPLPLSAVGVGVSQVLPILVMGLLAPKDTLLIVEQPELHLHPRVQARLGDFFMGLAKCGKQCLIETHSENLIS